MPSYLKKFCASAPATFPVPPGVPTRARARLDSGAGAFGWKRARAFGCRRAGLPSRWLLLAVVCGLCCVASGCRLWPCCCDRLALALLSVACACWLVACGGLYSWPVGWRLFPCSLPVLVEAVSLRPVGGLWGGVYIKLPGDYTWRIKPLPARLAVSLAACFRPLPGAVPEAAAGPVMGRRSFRLPVHL